MRGAIHTRRAGRSSFTVLALVAVGCALALAACGSSAKSSGSAGGTQAIKFASCMRSHGVPNFPDPGGGGGGIKIDSSSGIDPQSPAFQSAQRACAKLLPGGGPVRGPASEARKLAMLKLAECMRSHGVSGFPDPTSSPPSPGKLGGGPGGGGIAFGGGGSFIAVPQTLIQSPGFKQAATACGFPGTGGHGGGKTAAAG